MLKSKNGEKKAVFGLKTIKFTAYNNGLEFGNAKDELKAIAITFKTLNEAGISYKNIMPLGYSGLKNGKPALTYNDVLKTLTPQEKSEITPDILSALTQMGTLAFPENQLGYHIDTVFFSPDGKQAFMSQETEDTNYDVKEVKRLLTFHGYKIVTLLSGEVVAPNVARAKDNWVNPEMTTNSTGRLNYLNMVQCLTPDGRLAIMMPTEAKDPSKLTSRDIEVYKRLKKALPDAVIIPVGGRTAIEGVARFYDEQVMAGKNWGIHCLSQISSFIVTPK